MNSWIGGSLSSLKGQLSHLITEGTEEVLDPKGELSIAREKISDLENQIRSYSSDVRHLEEKNEELKIKLQSEEMLIQSVSDSYRDKLKEKEESLEMLRHELASRVVVDDGLHRIYDFVSEEGSMPRRNIDNDEIARLTQEVQKWRSFAENLQCNSIQDTMNDSIDQSVSKLLESQRQELELQHSTYILELQQEHNRQLGFLKRRLQRSVRSSEADEFETSPFPDATVSEATSIEVSCQTLSEPMDFVTNTSFNRSIVGDAMSQISDVSEVSTRSRLLEDHVRHLSSRIEEYERQLTSIDDVTVDLERDSDPEQLTDKLQDLKIKLSERKNVIIGQNNLSTCIEVHEQDPGVITDSWENSSINSVVEEPNVECKVTSEMKSVLHAIFDTLHLDYSDTDDSKILESLLSIKEKAVEVMELVVENEQLKEQLEGKRVDRKEDVCMDSEDILEHVKSFNEEKDEWIEKLESRIVSLQNLCEEKDDCLRLLRARETEIINEYDCSIDVLNCELDNVRALIEKSHETEAELCQELGRLRADVQEKEDMIRSLNEELTMLSHEEDVRSVLEVGEACSQTEPNGEEERLQAVVEAQADSLAKYESRSASLEAEVARLSSLPTVTGISNEDEDSMMARETMHRLSQIVRDKDFELEAVKARNESLLQLLSQEDGGMTRLEVLLQEKEAVAKELLWYQENREQLVAALNLKHKESLGYHGEIQRLVAFINAEQTKWAAAVSEQRRVAMVDAAAQFTDKEEEEVDEEADDDGDRLREEVASLRARLEELQECHGRCLAQAEEGACKLEDIWGAAGTVVAAGVAVDTDQSQRCQEHLEQIAQLQAREAKLLRDKQAFQEHLIRIEESYTQDATIAEDREQSLRKQLRDSEDQLFTFQEKVTLLENKIASATENFLSETYGIRTERDEAVKKLRETELHLSETINSLNNLQAVVDKFQQEQALELSFQKERLQQELRSMIKERNEYKTECHQLRLNIDAQNSIVEAAQRLTDQMEHKDDELAEMQAKMSRKDEVIDNLKMEIRKLNSVTESKVDKVLMRNLVIGYFHTPISKRQDALRVIGSLLQFSDKDYNQIGIDTVNKSRWFSWLRATGPENKDHDPQSPEQSFSELFVRFLERESTPLPQLRLPTNQVAAEARRHTSLSHSEDFPYTAPTSMAPIPDHHQFFSSSPMVTKRTGATGDEHISEASPQKDAPPLFISSLQELNVESQQNKPKPPSSHRRGESNRNALLSLLEQ